MPCKECDRRDSKFIQVRARRAQLHRTGRLTKELADFLDSQESEELCSILEHKATHRPDYVFE